MVQIFSEHAHLNFFTPGALLLDSCTYKKYVVASNRFFPCNFQN